MKEALLIGQIQQELSQVQVMISETGRMLEKVQHTADKDYLGTIALNLQSFYTAVERILVAIAKEIDTTIPQEENWHQALLAQMVVEIPGTRQPVLTTQTQQGLDEFRRFRHVVRSNYAHRLDPERVQALARKLDAVSQYLIRDCQRFCAELKSLEREQDIQR